MGLTANLHSLGASTCEAFARLDASYRPGGGEPEAMVAGEVYGARTGDDAERTFLHAVHALPDLRAFARRCAEQGCGALVVIA